MTAEEKQCQNCKQNFVIEPEDFDFYKKIDVPAPTFCPDCRSQRRMMWRNERTLFKRKCNFTNKDLISCFSSDSGVNVYDRNIWWSDNWNPFEYGQDYDFSLSFFLQFKKLLNKVPMPAVFNGQCLNSDYCNHVGQMKDCYLDFASWDNENVCFSGKASFSKEVYDGLSLSHCEKAYQIINSARLYNCYFADTSESCTDCFFVSNCKGSSHCFGCINLRNKSYYIFNKPYSKEDYFIEIEKYNLGSYKGLQGTIKVFNDLKSKSIRKFANLINTQNVTGDNLGNVADSYNCFDLFDDVKDCKFVINGGFGMRDCYDSYGIGASVDLCYESIDSGLTGSRQLFDIVSWGGTNVQYSYNCHNCNNLFGCIGLRNASYCVFNKQYSKEEYEMLLPRIVKHMSDVPYVDKRGIVYKYGEFFPGELSPFAYNETIAQEYYPSDKDSVMGNGYEWRESEEKNYEVGIPALDLPDDIKNVSDDILTKTIGCEHRGICKEQCTKAFRITKDELRFYKLTRLPLPRLCPNCRHYERLRQQRPLRLWKRECGCNGVGSVIGDYVNTVAHQHKDNRCPNAFQTSYAPDRPEIVYCEQCYNAEVV